MIFPIIVLESFKDNFSKTRFTNVFFIKKNKIMKILLLKNYINKVIEATKWALRCQIDK